MVKRTVNFPEDEPDQITHKLPSESEHLFQVIDIYTCDDEVGQKLNLDYNTVSVKCEVVGGQEEGRTLLNRISLDPEWKGFFATRLFLKAIGFPHKGDKIYIDTDEWIGVQFYATVIHNGKYANIDSYNFDKKVDNSKKGAVVKEATAWDENI